MIRCELGSGLIKPEMQADNGSSESSEMHPVDHRALKVDVTIIARLVQPSESLSPSGPAVNTYFSK